MNNKGFGLSELLVFIGIFLFALVAVAIYGSVKLGNDSYYDKPDVDVDETEINDLTPTEMEIPKEYILLENKIKNAALKYSYNKNENIIITKEQLQKASLLGELKDPYDNTVICDGYVVYNSSSKSLTPYINCTGMYATENYDENLLK